MFALCDCNNFFVSCERVFRPDLRSRPVVVLSGNDGCVVSRSNEVKRLGIPMGVPFYQIKAEVEQYGIVAFSSNFALYGDLSSRIMRMLSRYTPELQQYSIDEAFLDLSHMPDTASMVALCRRLRSAIDRGIGVPVSFGIAPTKTLCKVATDYAKHFAGYHGVCAMETDAQRRKALADYPVEDVWGIGRRSVGKLQSAGITTALALAEHSEAFVRNLLHQPGVLTWRELNGEPCITDTDHPEKQSIMCSRTFAHPVTDRTQLEQALAAFCDNVAAKLRRQHSVCRQMIVFAHTSRFNADAQQPMRTIRQTVTFATPTANTQELTSALLQVVRSQWQPDTPYKRAGVLLLAIEPDNGVQQSLFDTRNRERDSRLQQVLDTINNRHGRHTVGFTPNMPDETTAGLYEAGKKSPAYTTRMQDVITLKC
ncbi:MAG: Y-family DNA polymerase [Paludibacteraceae bacterium]|nr:Y-family DNA polymerase [Paludibacteraceae bacterium]